MVYIHANMDQTSDVNYEEAKGRLDGDNQRHVAVTHAVPTHQLMFAYFHVLSHL